MYDNKNQLREDAIELAIQISDLCDEIKGCSVYVNQIVRASSSIGANIHEAKYAQSKADFVAKMSIALKEANETHYWLKLLYKTDYLSEAQYNSINTDINELVGLLMAICKTASANK